MNGVLTRYLKRATADEPKIDVPPFRTLPPACGPPRAHVATIDGFRSQSSGMPTRATRRLTLHREHGRLTIRLDRRCRKLKSFLLLLTIQMMMGRNRRIVDRMSLQNHSRTIQERRQHLRMATTLQAAFTSPDGEVGEGTTMDLSPGGCKIHCLSPVILNAQIEIQIFIPGENIPITVPMGLVRWTAGTSCGVEFLQLTEASRQLIRHLFGPQE